MDWLMKLWVAFELRDIYNQIKKERRRAERGEPQEGRTWAEWEEETRPSVSGTIFWVLFIVISITAVVMVSK